MLLGTFVCWFVCFGVLLIGLGVGWGVWGGFYVVRVVCLALGLLVCKSGMLGG